MSLTPEQISHLAEIIENESTEPKKRDGSFSTTRCLNKVEAACVLLGSGNINILLKNISENDLIEGTAFIAIDKDGLDIDEELINSEVSIFKSIETMAPIILALFPELETAV